MPENDVDIGIRLRGEGAAIAAQVTKDLNAMRNSLYSLTTAARANASAVQGQTNVLQQQLGVLTNIQKQTAATAKSTEGATSSMYGLAKSVVVAAAAFAGFQGFKTFVAAGLEFNQTMEDAELGIATLITAQARLHDKNGVLLTGTQALTAAQDVAADQMVKLRIAGLQTVATTQELVQAFQQAVGIGLKWNFTLDQSREFTIRMAQAAKTLQLPMNQLNEEIRDLLAGNINSRNTRIATALNITNEQIRQAQVAGTLFDFVSKRLEAFGVAGEATAKTFSGVMSNIKDSFQLVAGDATNPLFDSLKKAGLDAMDEIFDMKNARISEKFSGIIEVAQKTFGVLGDMLSGAIGGAIHGAEALSGWLEKNSFLVDDIFEGFKLIVGQVKGLIKDTTGVVLGMEKANIEGGQLNIVFRMVALAVAGLRDGLKFIVSILGLIGGIVLEAILDPFRLLLKAIAAVVQFTNKDMAESLRNTAARIDGFLTETSHGVKDIWKDFASGNTATARVIAQMDDMGKAADKTTEKVKKTGKELATVTSPPPTKPGKPEPTKVAKSLTDTAKAELSRAERDLAISLAKNEISYREYYETLTRLQQGFIDAQIHAQEVLRDNPKATQDAKDAASAAIRQLEQERAQVVQDNAEKLRVALKALQEDVTKANIQLLKDQGRFAEARALEVEDKFKESQARLIKNSDAAGAAIVAKLFNIDNAKAQMQGFERQAKLVTDELAQRLDEINTDVTAHAKDEREAREAITAAYQKAQAAVTAMLPAMEKAARLTEDPAAIAAVDALKTKWEQWGVTIKQTSDDLFKFKEQARETFKNSLAQFLDDAATGAKSLGESFMDMARSIVASLRQIAAQMIANIIIQQAMHLVGFAGGGAVSGKGGGAPRLISGDAGLGGGLPAATGGHILGPGTGTSDSIPAWLSHGEYVINARAVRDVGVDLLDEINAMGQPTVRHRRQSRRYASGGLVSATDNDVRVDNRMTVGLEDGLVLRHLESPEGTAAQIRFIEKNAKKIKQSLGIGR